jgi:hypothetical protein
MFEYYLLFLPLSENMKLREKVRRLAQENDELVQELSEMKGTKSTHNIMFASKSENTQEMNVSFELIHQNNFMKEQLFYKEKETATLKESCKTSTNLEMHVYRLHKEKKDLEDGLNHVLVMEKEEKKTYIHLQSEFRESIGKIVNAEEKIKLQASEISLLKLENDKTEQLKKENNDLYLAVCNYIRGKKRLNHVLVMEKEEKKTYIHLQSEFRESIGKIVNAEEKIKRLKRRCQKCMNGKQNIRIS